MLNRPIVVVGAGPAGALCSLHLARLGVPCLLLDAATFPRPKTCGDGLSPKALKAIHDYDPALLQRLLALPQAQPYRSILFQAPDGTDYPFALPPYTRLGLQVAGVCVPRYYLDGLLVAEAEQHPLIDLRTGVQVVRLKRADDHWLLSLNDDNTLEAACLVVADGAHSRLAPQLGLLPSRGRWQAVAIRRYYTGVDLPTGSLELRYYPGLLPGYVWLFDIGNGLTNVGLIVRSDVARSKKLNLHTALDHCLQQGKVKQYMNQAQQQGHDEGYTLPLYTPGRPLSGSRWLVVGDAASLVDPFTGEGIGNALLSGQKAAEALATAYHTQDYSDARLRHYDDALRRNLYKELRINRALEWASRYPRLLSLGLRATRMWPLRPYVQRLLEQNRSTD